MLSLEELALSGKLQVAREESWRSRRDTDGGTRGRFVAPRARTLLKRRK
jgi:hypothetical protein